MKAAVLTNDGFEIQDVEKPAIRADELLIEILACGVCSGDLFVYQNRAQYAQSTDHLGHEGSGKIVAIGSQVSNFSVGDIVTALSWLAYAEYFVATCADLVKLPPEVDPAFALGEAVACCVHASDRFDIQPGSKVAVVGCGFMGLICLQLAKYQGAGFICAIDPLAERRAMGQQLGATVTYNPITYGSAEILDAHGDFDVVIEAAGVQSAVDLCSDLVTEHGLIILVGYHQSNNGLRTVNMQQWNFKAIDVVNGHVRRQDEKLNAMQRGMEMLAEGYLVTQPLVSIYDFVDIESAFRDLSARTPGLFKAVLLMGKSA
jgi:threonine dehydrogenase-like Zn-dependent dehydrogenase